MYSRVIDEYSRAIDEYSSVIEFEEYPMTFDEYSMGPRGTGLEESLIAAERRAPRLDVDPESSASNGFRGSSECLKWTTTQNRLPQVDFETA